MWLRKTPLPGDRNTDLVRGGLMSQNNLSLRLVQGFHKQWWMWISPNCLQDMVSLLIWMSVIQRRVQDQSRKSTQPILNNESCCGKWTFSIFGRCVGHRGQMMWLSLTWLPRLIVPHSLHSFWWQWIFYPSRHYLFHVNTSFLEVLRLIQSDEIASVLFWLRHFKCINCFSRNSTSTSHRGGWLSRGICLLTTQSTIFSLSFSMLMIQRRHKIPSYNTWTNMRKMWKGWHIEQVVIIACQLVCILSSL